MSVSPFTGEQQVYVHPGEFWMAEAELIPMHRDDAEQWAAWLTALNGMEGTFLMGVPLGETARGGASGSPTVSGAGQTGKTLVTAGWTAGAAIKAGDYIQLGSSATTRLHKVVQDATASGGGAATLEIWPRLRGAPTNGAAITISNPKGRWRLASNDRGWDLNIGRLYDGLTFSAVEAL